MNIEKKSPKQQIVEKIKNANNILLVSHVNPDEDAIGSVLALSHTLKKLGKNITVACSGQNSDKHQFLPDFDSVKNEIVGTRQFIITLNTTHTGGPHKVKYQTEDDKIHLIVTPDSGNFSQDDVTIREGKHQFDLIIVTDTPNLDRLDKIYDENSELFFEIPIINIDHHGDNNNFGEINLVDPKSSSVCEILVSIIEALSTDKPLLDSSISTCILTGILGDTASFQNSNTTSKSLTVAAQMIAGGAEHLEIIKNIFRTQPLPRLKIWGKILTKLRTKPSLKLAWSAISLADLKEAGAEPNDTSGVIEALIRNLPDTDIFLLIVQTEELIKGSLRSNPPIDINAIATELGGGGHSQSSGFRLYDMTLAEAEEKVLQTIEKHLSSESKPNIDPTVTNQNSTLIPPAESSITPPTETTEPAILDNSNQTTSIPDNPSQPTKAPTPSNNNPTPTPEPLPPTDNLPPLI
ncbi:MAG: DHH family phosphoesterase [Patescibacteria group bacterium]